MFVLIKEVQTHNHAVYNVMFSCRPTMIYSMLVRKLYCEIINDRLLCWKIDVAQSLFPPIQLGLLEDMLRDTSQLRTNYLVVLGHETSYS